jgi:hypothetical protein
MFPQKSGFSGRKKKRDFRGSMDLSAGAWISEQKKRDYVDATGPKRTRKKQTEAKRDQKEAFITLSPSRVETRCLSSYGPLHST